MVYFIANQNVNYSQDSGSIIVKSAQNGSTPGILKKHILEPNSNYCITIIAESSVVSKLWIGSVKGRQMLYLSQESFHKTQTIAYSFNSGHRIKEILYGVFFIEPKIGDSVKVFDISIEQIKVKGVYPMLKLIRGSSNQTRRHIRTTHNNTSEQNYEKSEQNHEELDSLNTILNGITSIPEYISDPGQDIGSLYFQETVIINLKIQPHKKYLMNVKMRNAGLTKYTVFPAINGYNKPFIDIYNQNKNEMNIVKSPGAFGLLVTYKKLISYLLDKYKNEPLTTKFLILEDDVYFHKNFKHEIMIKFNHIKDCDVIYLGSSQINYDAEQLSLIKKKQNYKLIKLKPGEKFKSSKSKENRIFGTFGLCLSKKILIALKFKLNYIIQPYPLDWLVYITTLEQNLECVVIYPQLIIAEVRESLNMGHRDIYKFSQERNWDLSLYDISLWEKINAVQNKINHLNIRSIKDFTLPGFNHQTSLKLVEQGKSFAFIIPSYNNAEWYKKNLDSIIQQNYNLWRIFYIDDASTDNTYEFVNKYKQESEFGDKITILRNDVQMHQAYSRRLGYMQCDPDEICILLDGDDWLYDDNVLSYLNKLYLENDLECSYGQFYPYEKGQTVTNQIYGKKEFPINVKNNKSYRQYPEWISQHLRTCRAGLLQSIPESALKDSEGQWFDRCTDWAEMFWVLEKSDGRHQNANRVLCVYNRDNSLKYANSYYRDCNSRKRKKIEELIKNYHQFKVPKILVITPFYNTEKFLQKSIESILNQKGVDIHLVLVNDCSTDNSHNIAELYKDRGNVTILTNKTNRGAYYSRNRGLMFLSEHLDQFDFYTVFDSDDIAFINRYEVMVEKFSLNPNIVGLLAKYIRVHEDLSPSLNNGNKIIINGIGQSLFKTEVFKQLGFYKNLRHSADTDYWWRLEALCKKNNWRVEYLDNILHYAINRDDCSNLTKVYNNNTRQPIYKKIKEEIAQMSKLNNFYRYNFE